MAGFYQEPNNEGIPIKDRPCYDNEKRKVPVCKELFKEIIIGHRATDKTVNEIVKLRNDLFPSVELKKCFCDGQSIKIRKHEST